MNNPLPPLETVLKVAHELRLENRAINDCTPEQIRDYFQLIATNHYDLLRHINLLTFDKVKKCSQPSLLQRVRRFLGL